MEKVPSLNKGFQIEVGYTGALLLFSKVFEYI